MKYKKFGNTGISASVIGMGTYYDPLWIITAKLGWLRDRKRKVEALVSGLKAGINLIDTAELYGSEPLVGEAIRGFQRKDILISTKVWPTHLRREKLLRSLEGSLRRLGTDYVDFYLIHFPGSRDANREALAAMEEAVASGMIRYIGLSNFDLNGVIEARKMLKKNDIAVLQNEYNLNHRNPEKDLIPYCEKEGIAFMAYYPLAHGALVNNSRLLELSRRYGATPAQLALLWLLRWSSVFPIPRASREEHVLENARAADIDVPEEALKLL
ncbi:MAG: aldo/keto reductase [Nitrososphaeria archaeon]